MSLVTRSDARLVCTWKQLRDLGHSPKHITSQLAAQRWQRIGGAIVLHNGPLSQRQRWLVARVHGGPQAILTAFTATSAFGLQNWERDVVHLLVPSGTRPRRECHIPIRLHMAEDWDRVARHRDSVVHVLPDALLRAAATFDNPRPACGILAAAVQQRKTTASSLRSALEGHPRLRHHAILLDAVDDIQQGSQALSEIDFIRLCRRYGLPEPRRQAVRTGPGGRRRYLDAEWRRHDGRSVLVEVDGALHLVVGRWWDDQLRQNELALSDALLLRYPSVVVRTEPGTVIRQLRRALLID